MGGRYTLPLGRRSRGSYSAASTVYLPSPQMCFRTWLFWWLQKWWGVGKWPGSSAPLVATHTHSVESWNLIGAVEWCLLLHLISSSSGHGPRIALCLLKHPPSFQLRRLLYSRELTHSPVGNWYKWFHLMAADCLASSGLPCGESLGKVLEENNPGNQGDVLISRCCSCCC